MTLKIASETPACFADTMVLPPQTTVSESQNPFYSWGGPGPCPFSCWERPWAAIHPAPHQVEGWPWIHLG